MLFILRYIISIGQLLLNSYFMGNYLTCKRANKAGAVIYILAVPVIIILLNETGILLINVLAAYFMSICLCAVIFKCSWKRVLVVGAAAYAVNMLCEIAILYCTSLLMKYPPSEILTSTNVEIVFSLMALILFFVVSWSIRSYVKRINFDGKPLTAVPSIRYLLLPLSLIMVGYFVLYVSKSYPEEFLSRVGLAILLTLIISDTILLFGSERENKRQQLQLELTAMRVQNDLTEEIIKLQEQYLDKIKGQAHDFKKHILHINDMLSTSPKLADNKTKEYVDQVLKDLITVDTAAFPAIQNNALRVILARTAENCQKNGIQFRTSLQYCEFSFMPYKDICAIFLNALENSIQACAALGDEAGEKYIELNIRCPEKIIQIHIVNPKPDNVKEENGILVSTKADSYSHGYGVKNIERIAREYGGTALTDYSGDTFELYINIPIPDSAYTKDESAT